MGQNGSSISPTDKAMEEIKHTRAKLQQLEEEYRLKFDTNRNSKNLVTKLQQKFSNLRRWVPHVQESNLNNVLLEAA